MCDCASYDDGSRYLCPPCARIIDKLERSAAEFKLTKFRWARKLRNDNDPPDRVTELDVHNAEARLFQVMPDHLPYLKAIAESGGLVG